MVTFEQLRISDDGQLLFIDAHVNKASYFNNVHLSKITICTEKQVSELNPQSYGSDFIYQADISTGIVAPLYESVQVLSEQRLMDEIEENGGWSISYIKPVEAEDCYLSIVFSGKYSALDGEYPPKLVVATGNFNPVYDSLESPNVLFTVEGTHYEEGGHETWRFKSKGSVTSNTQVFFYLFKQTEDSVYDYISLDQTDDKNFLHFLWQVWYTVPETTQKEVHLVLSKSDFDAASVNTNSEGQAINPLKPIATKPFENTDLSHNMFFVYVECEGSPAPDTPCVLDENPVLGITFDYGTIYQRGMNYTRELANNCNIPKEFIDFILNVEALKMSLETDHYIPAISYWGKLSGKNSNDATYQTKPCRCYE